MRCLSLPRTGGRPAPLRAGVTATGAPEPRGRACRRCLAAGVALAGASAVLLGALGAHALSDLLGVAGGRLWQTAVGYHFWHALAFTLTAFVAPLGRARRLALASFAGGMLLFCGSLYALALGAPDGVRVLVPLGGIGFVVGWLALANSVAASRR